MLIIKEAWKHETGTLPGLGLTRAWSRMDNGSAQGHISAAPRLPYFLAFISSVRGSKPFAWRFWFSSLNISVFRKVDYGTSQFQAPFMVLGVWILRAAGQTKWFGLRDRYYLLFPPNCFWEWEHQLFMLLHTWEESNSQTYLFVCVDVSNRRLEYCLLHKACVI